MDIVKSEVGSVPMNPGEKIAALGRDFSIIMSRIHSFGTDAVLLADFAKPIGKKLCCDLGTGCGIIPMLWQVWSCRSDCTAVELQQDGIDMLNRTIAINRDRLSGEITPICADMRNLGGIVERNYYDVVTCNPPYFRQDGGIINRDEAQAITRHELMCTIDDVTEAAKKLLKFGGRLDVCGRPDRLISTIEAMRRRGLEPKRLRLVQQRADKAPWLFLLEGKKGAKAGLEILPALIVENALGGYTDEMKKIYGEFGV